MSTDQASILYVMIDAWLYNRIEELIEPSTCISKRRALLRSNRRLLARHHVQTPHHSFRLDARQSLLTRAHIHTSAVDGQRL